MRKASFLFSVFIVMLGCEAPKTVPDKQREQPPASKPIADKAPMPDTNIVVLKISGLMKSKGDAT